MAESEINKLYIIVDEDYRDECENTVNEYMQRGYIPVGGVAVFVDEYGRVHYCQAMQKKQS